MNTSENSCQQEIIEKNNVRKMFQNELLTIRVITTHIPKMIDNNITAIRLTPLYFSVPLVFRIPVDNILIKK